MAASIKDKKLKTIFSFLMVLETLYLLTFFVIIYASKLPAQLLKDFTQFWITASFMLIPVFLLKNIFVGVMENGILSKRQKIWLIIRCIIYVLLTIYSYPLITSLGFCY